MERHAKIIEEDAKLIGATKRKKASGKSESKRLKTSKKT
jgi:hypothetical protein